MTSFVRIIGRKGSTSVSPTTGLYKNKQANSRYSSSNNKIKSFVSFLCWARTATTVGISVVINKSKSLMYFLSCAGRVIASRKLEYNIQILYGSCLQLYSSCPLQSPQIVWCLQYLMFWSHLQLQIGKKQGCIFFWNSPPGGGKESKHIDV